MYNRVVRGRLYHGAFGAIVCILFVYKYKYDGNLNLDWVIIISVVAALGLHIELIRKDKYIEKQYIRVDKIKENEKRYELAVNGVNDVLWEYDILENKIFIDDKWKHLWDTYDKSVHPEKFAYLKESIHKEDLKGLEKELSKILCGQKDYINHEFRVFSKDNNIAWIYIRGKCEKDEKGNAIRIAGFLSDNTVNRKKDEEINYLAYHDNITNAYNGRKFYEVLQSALEEVKQNNTKGAIIVLDIDNFKKINDILGHDYGDIILRTISKLLTCIIEERGLVFRIAGDEFGIILENIEGRQEVGVICNKILEGLCKEMKINGKIVDVSLSQSVTIFPDDSDEFEEVIKNANTSMHIAKENGRKSIVYFNEILGKEREQRLIMETDLKNSIQNGELMVYYQPKMDLNTGKIIGFEALLRWLYKKENRFIPPDQFIVIAEENGFIEKMGEWIIEEVCRNICYLKNKGLDIGKVAINISPCQIHLAEFPKKLNSILRSFNIPANVIELEITETNIMTSIDKNSLKLRNFMDEGFTIALDDFGTGYSSMNYLIKLPLNVLKIDKGFIEKIEVDERKKDIVNSIIKLAHIINLEVVAEGVESKEQMNILKSLECDIIQGYYISRPMPLMDVEEFVKKWS